MVDITLDGLTRSFGGMTAVKDISQTFSEGSVTCLLGPSGCGKTTLMRMIAGLETPSRGRILFGGRDVTALTPRQRNVAMVFQYPVMYRTLTVEENIALPLGRDRGLSAVDRQRRVEEVLDVLQLRSLRRGRMEELDIGTRQRVAVGRSIARRCDVILFDEPTTNVEVHAKLELIRAFKQFRQQLRQTIIYVTHDQTEAMTLADKIALMLAGAISQCAPPRALYEKPDSEFGGWFLGNPGMNFVSGRVTPQGMQFDILPTAITIPDMSRDIRLGIRPERIKVAPLGTPGTIAARIERRFITIGGKYLLTLRIGETVLRARADSTLGRVLGDEAGITCPIQHLAFFRDGTAIPSPHLA